MAAPTIDSPPAPVVLRDEPPKGVLGRLRATTASWLALRQTPYGIVPIVALCVVGFSQTLDDASFNFALPQFVKRGIDIGSLIEVEATIAFVAIFANLALGYYAERFRRVPLLVLGALVSGISCMFTGFSRTAGRLDLVRGLDSGIGSNLSQVPTSPLASDYYPPEVRARVFTMAGAFSATGRLLALPAAAIGLTYLGVEKFFIVVGAVLIAAGLLARLVLREPPRGGMERREVGLEEYADIEDEPMSFGESWRTVFAIRTVRRLFVADIVSGFGEVAQLYTILLLAIDYHLSPMGLALFSLPSVAVSLVTRFFVGSVIDRLLSTNVARVFSIYALFTGASGVGIVLFGFEPPIVVLVVAQCLLAFGGSLIGPAVGALYSQIIPARVRTLGLQITGLAAAPGLIIATPLFTQIFYKHGFGPVYFVAAPFYLAAGAVLLTTGAFFEADRANSLAVTAASRRWTLAKAAGAKQILSLQGVKVAYDGVPVVFGVDIEIDEGELVALLGTNGAGKSTVLRAMCGTVEASGGAILFDGKDITRMPPHEIARRGLVQMPGGKGTFPDLSVRDNLVLGGWIRKDAELGRDTDQLLDTFPVLRDRLDAPAGVLSGGEQQMLALALAFLMQPKMLLIDELTLGLSPAAVGELVEAVRRIHASGVTVLVIEQSVALALELADRAIFMEKGQVRFDGPTAELLKRPDIVRAVYLTGSAAVSDRSAPRRIVDAANPDLEVTGLTKRYGGKVALDDVTFALSQGETLGIIGPNGSGKTTLFDVISGLVPSDGGTVTLLGGDISEETADARARQGLVRRFQDARQFSTLSVQENLLLALEGKLGVRNPLLTSLGTPKARRSERRIRARADEVIELLELEAFRNKPTGELSTGLRRIVDLACVIAAEPKVLLLDEPSTGIAQAEAVGLAPLLRRVQRESGCSILIIEHHMPLLREVSDRFLALASGRLIANGDPDDVLADPDVSAAYLGAAAPPPRTRASR